MQLLLEDYPYAEDGLLIWNGLKKWNDDYLVRYGPGHCMNPSRAVVHRLWHRHTAAAC